MKPDELQAIACYLDPDEFMQWLVERPDVVEGLVVGATDEVRELIRTIHRGQQAVLAAGGGVLSITIDDDTGVHVYTATLNAEPPPG